MPVYSTDAIIVGAGAVGLACARALALRGHEVIVLEAADAIGQGVSSRNSEVLHAGIYYSTGSLRARLCVEGNHLIRGYLKARGIGMDPCGKLVVASSADELPRLEALYAQALMNKVPQVERLSGAQARALEPALRVDAGLLCGTSAVFDSHGYMLAMQGDIEDAGGRIALRTPFLCAEQERQGFVVQCGGTEPVSIACRLMVLAAGLGAQTVAGGVEGFPAAMIPLRHLAKGSYFALQGNAPFSRLIYPLPVPGSLGTHYRRDIGGVARFGPDIEWVDAEDYSVDPARKTHFVEAIRRFWPAVDEYALVPDYSGIRPKIHGPDEPQPDFSILFEDRHGMAGLAALFGIESPGLTSSMAIGDYVADALLAIR